MELGSEVYYRDVVGDEGSNDGLSFEQRLIGPLTCGRGLGSISNMGDEREGSMKIDAKIGNRRLRMEFWYSRG